MVYKLQTIKQRTTDVYYKKYIYKSHDNKSSISVSLKNWMSVHDTT
jgi:hypothetical protein